MAASRPTATHVARAVGLIAASVALALCLTPAYADPPSPLLPEMVTANTVKAIDRGLNYLVKTQRTDGSWLNSGGYGTYPAAMTGLAGLALMAGGSTPETGPYCRNVTRAMSYLLRVAKTHSDGLIGGPGAESRSMYGHGFSMLFLAQCYGTEINREYEKDLQETLTKAVQLTAQSQSDLGKAHNNAGGWIYTPTSNGDEGSVTVTQLQALRACRNVGIKVPKTTIDRAVAYLKYCQMPDGGICYSARSRGSSRPAISAAAIACFYAAGVYDRQTGGKGVEAEMVEKLVEYVRGHVSTNAGGAWGGHYFYTHFYLAQAHYQRGGKDWKAYYPQIRDRLLQMQGPDGSWNGDSVGTTYGTALATIILQLPYNYLPVYQK
ncbi:MAG TPA: prenyltransferase/squalene oxidase repeat-containing protein [Phycisphaerae bacterium]|nr:prenyltransferase/squalene oxidase repeat-containing protein [Phycisphaerae bacterium]